MPTISSAITLFDNSTHRCQCSALTKEPNWECGILSEHSVCISGWISHYLIEVQWHRVVKIGCAYKNKTLLNSGTCLPFLQLLHICNGWWLVGSWWWLCLPTSISTFVRGETRLIAIEVYSTVARLHKETFTGERQYQRPPTHYIPI